MENGSPAAPAPDMPAAESALPVVGASIVAIVGALLFAAFADLSQDEFKPRVETLDALAGLAVGAFLVDRVLTFVPPFFARKQADARAADLTVLRLAYGALLGAAFVSLTDLRAVAALTGDPSGISPGLDRAIAVLAIAGGVAGLAQLVESLNPQPDTDATPGPTEADKAPPPDPWARMVGISGLVAAGLLALTALGDKTGLELLGLDDPEADGTVALVVRFGVLLVAAGVIQQALGILVAPLVAKHNKALVTGAVAVIAGVGAARLLDLYLLHNIGFFGVTVNMKINDALAASSDVKLWADALLTGIAIAAGTKPLHDLSSRLRKPKEEKN